MNPTSTRRNRAAFTLTELLVSLGVVSLLAGLGATAYSKLLEKGREARELGAARQLMVSYQLYAQDHDGQVLPGYKDDPGVVNFEGKALYSPINGRYPWRLAPYIGTTDGTLVYNGNEQVLHSKNRDYLVSVRPNLGINATFVGGHYGSSSLLRPGPRMEDRIGRWYISHIAEPRKPSSLIVFASARSESSDGDATPGYFEVQPPRVASNIWSNDEFEKDTSPADHGFVDFRWGGRAVAAMFDGSVRLLDEEQMRDMRLWSDDAAAENDPDYSITY